MSAKTPTPNAEGLAAAAKAAQGRGLPPVDRWDPPFCGDLDMRIARDGTWFYEGTPIGRPALVALFASILRKDGGEYFLVTPVEKVRIKVEDVPFIAVDFEAANEGLRFVTNLGDAALAGPDHPIRVEMEGPEGAPAPYIRIRRNLEARIDRKSFYRLVELAETRSHEGEDWLGIASGGAFFPIIRAKDMEI